jgi:hypothetical protein
VLRSRSAPLPFCGIGLAERGDDIAVVVADGPRPDAEEWDPAGSAKVVDRADGDVQPACEANGVE